MALFLGGVALGGVARILGRQAVLFHKQYHPGVVHLKPLRMWFSFLVEPSVVTRCYEAACVNGNVGV